MHLPSSWPPEFPLPPDATVTADESDAQASRFVFSIGPDVDLELFFSLHLARSGWAVLPGDAFEDDEVAFEIEGHGYAGYVDLLPERGRFVVQLVR